MRWLKPVRPVIPLDRDASGRFLPFIIAGFTVLATLMLVLVVALSGGVRSWQGELTGKATVQILPLDKTAPPLSARVQAALDVLNESELVVQAEAVGSEQMTQLLAPWLGQGALPDDLPVPALIDITLSTTGAELGPLAESLKTVEGAQLDDHGAWLAQVRQLAWLGVAVAGFLLALIVGATLLMLVLLVQAAMEAHHEVIELLHLVGATDRFIARQLRMHMLLLALQGVVLGGLVAALLLEILGVYADKAGLALQLNWALLPVMPLLLVLLSVFTAQRVALRRLAELP